MNRLFIDRIKDLEDYVRIKKNGMKICFHYENNEDLKNNVKLVELFNNEININNLIVIGYKGSVFVKKINDNEYNQYKLFMNNKNINKKFNDIINCYCNNASIDLSGYGSSKIITTLILYYTKLYFEIPYNKKDEEKKKGIKWNADKKKWYIYYTNENLEYFIENYKITDDTFKYIDEYINTKTIIL